MNCEIAEFIPSHNNEIASPSARNDSEGPSAKMAFRTSYELIKLLCAPGGFGRAVFYFIGLRPCLVNPYAETAFGHGKIGLTSVQGADLKRMRRAADLYLAGLLY